MSSSPEKSLREDTTPFLLHLFYRTGSLHRYLYMTPSNTDGLRSQGVNNVLLVGQMNLSRIVCRHIYLCIHGQTVL